MIDDLAESGIEYKPNPIQVRFAQDPRQFRWLCGGYGTGKTTELVMQAFGNAVFRHPGFTGAVVAPSYALLFQAWFAEWCQWIPREWWTLRQDSKSGAEITLALPDGKKSKILLRSTSNPWGNEGTNLAWAIFDEASRERNVQSYRVLASRLRRGYPGRQRDMCLSGPPSTRKHWTAAEFGWGPKPAENGKPAFLGHSLH